MNSQPACVFFGDLVRREMKTAVPRDATDRQTAAEGIADAVAIDPALALEQFEARASEQKFARERGITWNRDGAVRRLHGLYDTPARSRVGWRITRWIVN